jgi:hypothetical protein
MKANRSMFRGCVLTVAFGMVALLAGCATQPSNKAGASYAVSDVEGRWSWAQGPYNGEFVLKQDGDKCCGTLDDVVEGTYGDKIEDVAVTGDHIKLTRNGQFGVQNWEGTLTKEKGVLKIVDGRWTKVDRGVTGTFTAEKKKK